MKALLFSILGASLLALMPSAPASGGTLCDSLSAGRYDIIYVCPAAWRTQVARLAIHRSLSQYGNYSSIIAPTESLAACYGVGRRGIRSMLDHALSSWSAPPKHVVLVGAYDSFDTASAIVPTWFIPDPTIGYWDVLRKLVATDDPYVFAVGTTDSTPVLSLGRIPVWDDWALGRYIDKVFTYESQTGAAWKSRAMHVIDDGDFDGNSGYLTRLRSDSLADGAIAGREVYFTRQMFYYTTSSPISRLLPVIQAWNDGVGFVLAYGARGSGDQMGYFDWSGQRCYSPAAWNESTTPRTLIDTLHVNSSCPVVLAMTCSGSYVNRLLLYGQESLCAGLPQYLLATPGKGAIVICGPSRAIRETAAFGFARAWIRATFAEGLQESVKEPGMSVKRAKQLTLSTLRKYKNEILSVQCLGDPALQMEVVSVPVVGVSPGGLDASPSGLMVRVRQSPTSRFELDVAVPSAGEYIVRVADVQGRTVLSQGLVARGAEQTFAFSLPTGGLPAGVYFVLIRGQGRTASTRVVLLP